MFKFILENLSTLLSSGGIIFLLAFFIAGVRIIPNTKVAVVERRWSSKGSIKSGFMALAGEAGYSPDLLRGGFHWFMPIQYRIIKAPLVTIPQGKIGYVFARDGKPLPATQTLAIGVFEVQDARGFLAKGGQKGPQINILREGTYAINPALFIVFTESQTYGLDISADDHELQRMANIIAERQGFVPVIIRGADDNIGVVTVHDGPGLAHGDVIAPIVGEDPKAGDYHNNFQDPEKFLQSGGRRGRQLQVLVDGTYYINRLFATVELIPKTVIEVGTVGVVVSYTGDTGKDLSGDAYSHGELVKKGERGVWDSGLMPGKYAFNTYAGKIVVVPTTNFILKWEETEVSAHKFDENLCEVGLITKDAFEPWLPLSVVVHIDYRKAPLVVQRFGDIKRLVNQTLDPMVSAYFKNIAQTRTLIELIQQRSEIQNQASVGMKEKFAQYNLELEEVLIGTPSPDEKDKQIDTILIQLRSRQIAAEQVSTFARQQEAAAKERELREAEARARSQQKLTESEISIKMEENEGKAEYQRSLQKAEQTRATARAEADQIRYIAEAESEKVARIGIAQALAIEEQVRAYGGPKYQLTQQVMNRFSEAVETSKIDVVPRIMVNGGGQGAQGSIFETLLTMMLSEKMDGIVGSSSTTARPEADALRKKIMDDISRPNGSPVQTPVA
jgi:uncharacterized membrane protein YqiK